MYTTVQNRLDHTKYSKEAGHTKSIHMLLLFYAVEQRSQHFLAHKLLSNITSGGQLDIEKWKSLLTIGLYGVCAWRHALYR